MVSTLQPHRSHPRPVARPVSPRPVVDRPVVDRPVVDRTGVDARVFLRRRLVAGGGALVLAALMLVGLSSLANRADADPAPGSTSGLSQNGTTRHVVQPGESLWTIAQRVAPGRDTRTVVDAIQRANAGLGAGTLQAGQLLLIPPSS